VYGVDGAVERFWVLWCGVCGGEAPLVCVETQDVDVLGRGCLEVDFKEAAIVVWGR
jgi:hypothetical protein